MYFPTKKVLPLSFEDQTLLAFFQAVMDKAH
jgi:hypothetical protein